MGASVQLKQACEKLLLRRQECKKGRLWQGRRAESDQWLQADFRMDTQRDVKKYDTP